MAERLARITREMSPHLNAFRNREHVAFLEKEIAAGEPLPNPLKLWMLANEQLNAGMTAESIAVFDRLERGMQEVGVPLTSDLWQDLRMRQAIAHLRRAEEDNCVLHHNPRSCIFPITGTGLHRERRGAVVATSLLSGLLEANPGNLQARWLLNIAAMTLGEYPDGVDRRWLLPPALFDSEGPIQRFDDVAAKTHLDVDDLAGGAVVDDMDGDNHLDLVVSALGLSSQLRYFRNQADGSFVERTAEAGLTGLTGGLNLIQADYDNDGDIDLLVLRGAWMGPAGHYPNSLLRNNGDGTFSDVTEEAGMLSFHPTQTAVWFDFDSDGWLDLFIGNETTQRDVQPSELYHNNRNGAFTECAQANGVAMTEFVKAVVSGDMDNDGRPDLYVSIRGGPNRLLHNDGPSIPFPQKAAGGCPPWRFTDVAEAAGVTEPIHSFPAWFWDYDNDGWEDIFVSGYLAEPEDIAADSMGLKHKAELPRLYRNNHDGTFADVTERAGLSRLLLTMGSNYGDLDNDGWLDMYLGTGNPDLGMLLPNRAFRNEGGRLFQDVTTAAGLGHLQKGHVVSFADMDNDGDQDIYHVVGGAFEADHFRNALFENPGTPHHWISLRLAGVASNRSAIGARLHVVTRTQEGERSIHRTVRSGGSFGASPLRQEIGLGDAQGVERVEIQWPAGAIQVIGPLEMDRHYLVREGSTGAIPLPLKSYRLGEAAIP